MTEMEVFIIGLFKQAQHHLRFLSIILIIILTITTTSSADSLSLTANKNLTYATVKTGETLTAESFISAIEKNHLLKIESISFSGNQRANTLSQGLLKTAVTFTTDKNEAYTAKLPYLIEAKEPTIELEKLHYDAAKNQISFRTSDYTAIVYMVADGKVFSCHPDANGLFKGKYNPHKQPEKLEFISFDDSGNYSAKHIFSIKENKEIDESDLTLLDNNTRNELKTTSIVLQPSGQNTSQYSLIVLGLISGLVVLFFTLRYFLKHKKQN